MMAMAYEWIGPYCPRCGYHLFETSHPNFAWCSVCGQHVAIHDWLEQPFMISKGYTHFGEMYEDQMWHGVFVYENCVYCGQPIQKVTDPPAYYCLCCGEH